MSQILLRAARSDDAARLTQIAMGSKAYWGYSAAFMQACEDELSVAAEDIAADDSWYVTAEQDGELLAFYALYAVDNKTLEMDALFVLPAYIGQGIGKKLMQHAIALAQRNGYQAILIQSDPHAEAFYRAQGAQTIALQASGSIVGRSLPLMRYQVSNDE